MTTTRALAVLMLAATAATLPAGAAAAQEPDDVESVYCVYQDPVTAYGITVYPGGRYCVPGP
jgi:hypothetical protein